MRSLLDVNFLIALFDPDHIHNGRAIEWWGKHARDGWASCPITENGLLRVLSHPNYSKKVRFSVFEVAELFKEFIDATDHEFWNDEISICDETLFDVTRIHGPKQLTDGYLLGLAVRNGARLVTLDGRISISAVAGAAKSYLTVV